MQEVSVTLEAVGILGDGIAYFHFLIEVSGLLVSRVVTLCTLESVENSAVVINNFCKVLDTICSIQRIIGVQAGWVRRLLLVEGHLTHLLRVQLRCLQVNLQHFLQ
jgi:hypothetical protein